MNLRVSIFLVLAVFPFALSHAAPLKADRGRPFGEGSVLGFPGADYYAGDLSHEVRTVDPLLARDPLGRWSRWSVVRTNPFSRAGTGLLLFDGIACPLPSSYFLGILPAGAGSVEFHDFPAGAWWGPGASNGAVQLRAPLFDPDTLWTAGAWGGVPGQTGAFLNFPGDLGTLAASFRNRAEGFQSNEADAWTVTTRGRWERNENLRMSGGTLLLKGTDDERWMAAYGDIRSGFGAFNEWSLKPYAQQAKAGSLEAREAGLEARTLFNMAGFIETQFAGGGSLMREDFDGTSSDSKKGFLQSTASFDALGLVMGDMGVRGDFRDRHRPCVSLDAGLQGHYGFAGMYVSTERVTLPWTGGRTEQSRAGLRYRPNDGLDVGAHLLEGASDVLGDFHGAGSFLHVSQRLDGLLLIPDGRVQCRIEAQILKSSAQGDIREVSGEGILEAAGGRVAVLGWAAEGERPGWGAWLEGPMTHGFRADVRYTKEPQGSGTVEAWTAGVRFTF